MPLFIATGQRGHARCLVVQQVFEECVHMIDAPKAAAWYSHALSYTVACLQGEDIMCWFTSLAIGSYSNKSTHLSIVSIVKLIYFLHFNRYKTLKILFSKKTQMDPSLLQITLSFIWLHTNPSKFMRNKFNRSGAFHYTHHSYSILHTSTTHRKQRALLPLRSKFRFARGH